MEEREVKLINSMYPCQDIPVVVFGKRCSSPCLYCGLQKYQFPDETVIASGVEDVALEISKYKGTYFSPVTDCFLPENSELTHYLLEEVWKFNPGWVPLVVTKQVIPEKTIHLLIQNKKRVVIQISVPSSDEKLISILEPGSVSISKRFEVIQKLTAGGIAVIVVIMPWFDLGITEDLAKKISEAGVLRVIISNGILTQKTREKMIASGDQYLIQVAESVCFVKEATEKGLVFSREMRINSLRRLTNALNNFGIKVKVCISDNHDLGDTGLPLCGKFRHHNFKD